MPTLLEAWLAEQTAEHVSWEHPTTSRSDALEAKAPRHPRLHFSGLEGRRLDSEAPHITCTAEPQARAPQWLDRYIRRRGWSRLRWL